MELYELKLGGGKSITASTPGEAKSLKRRLQKKGANPEIKTRKTYTEEEGVAAAEYPPWLYVFARRVLADMDYGVTAYCRLPFMKESQVRRLIEEMVYSPYPYGSPPLQNMARRAWEAHLLIEKALKEHGKNPVVMSSMGKDSMVVLHMVLMHKPDTHVLFNDTGVEHPDTYRFVKKIKKEWNINMVTTRPKTSFWQIKNTYGWPLKGRGVNDKASEACCKALKKEPTKRAVKEYGWNLAFLGLNKHESWNRYRSALRYGDYFYAKTMKQYRCYPILHWTESEIWDYTVFFNLPVNELYRPLPHHIDRDEAVYYYRTYPEEDIFHWEDSSVIDKYVPGYTARTGCWPCSIALSQGKLRYYRIFYPRLFNILVINQGLGLDILNKNDEGNSMFPATREEVKETLEIKPCVFDYG